MLKLKKQNSKEWFSTVEKRFKPNEQKTKFKYTGERMIPEYNNDQSIYIEHISRYVFTSQFVKGKSVLDIACGSGYGSKYLASNGALFVTAADIDLKSIDYAKKRYAAHNLRYVLANAESKLPFGNYSFDVIVSLETIEHLNDQKMFINEIKRVLKSKGVLVLSTPNKLASTHANKFHKKELSLSTLSKLVSSKFQYISIFPQNRLLISAISNQTPNNIQIISARAGEENKLSNCDSLIVVASDFPLPIIDPTYVLFDENQALEYRNMAKLLFQVIDNRDNELKQIHESWWWKTARVVNTLTNFIK